METGARLPAENLPACSMKFVLTLLVCSPNVCEIQYVLYAPEYLGTPMRVYKHGTAMFFLLVHHNLNYQRRIFVFVNPHFALLFALVANNIHWEAFMNVFKGIELVKYGVRRPVLVSITRCVRSSKAVLSSTDLQMGYLALRRYLLL